MRRQHHPTSRARRKAFPGRVLQRSAIIYLASAAKHEHLLKCWCVWEESFRLQNNCCCCVKQVAGKSGVPVEVPMRQYRFCATGRQAKE